MADIKSLAYTVDLKLEKFLEIYVSVLAQKQKQANGLSDIPNYSFDPETISFDKEAVKKSN